MRHASSHLSAESLRPDIAAYRAGDSAAGDRLALALHPIVRRDVFRFLGDSHADGDDVCQEAILAGLGYLTRDLEFTGDLVHLVVTIARNRCRDLWRRQNSRRESSIEPMIPFLEDPGRSFLEDLDAREMASLLQKTLDQISPDCRHLLKALYLDGISTLEVMDLIGLTTVQGVYHRRSVCLAKMKKLLQIVFTGRSGDVEIQNDLQAGRKD